MLQKNDVKESFRFTETLVMYDFTFAQELDRIAYIGIIDQTEQIVVRGSCFLFGSHIFVQIGDRITFDADVLHVKRYTGRGNRINTYGVIDKVCVETGLFNVLNAQIFRQLMQDCRYNFKMRQFFRACKGDKKKPSEQVQACWRIY